MHLTLQILFEEIILAYIALSCLLGYGWPGYQGRARGAPLYVLWFILGIIALVAMVLLLIMSS